MPKVSDAYRQARRDEIIDVAIECFGMRGFTRTSIADLVTESGLSAGAIYGSFPGGKDEIFVAAATRILHSRRSELDVMRAQGPLSPGEIMATLLQGLASERFVTILPQLWGEALVTPDILGLVQGVFHELRATIVDAVEEWARAHPEKAEGEPRAWAERVMPIIFSTAPGYILQRSLLPDFDAEEYVRSLPEVLPH